ncbi:acetyl esterase/lipase [Rhizobium sullae]|uniref:Acetyl esterase/lipase n=1 Tax=Rhizobium sullae TaxID=50338 RepID=A0A4R3Q6C6_RHISU|nr:acetyl esterase/lipase [Rhizobium sullae]
MSEKDTAIMVQIREALKGIKGTATGPDARPMFDDVMKGVAPAEGIEDEEGIVGGVPGIWVRPRSGPDDRVILYLHGGAYVIGSPRAYVNLVGQMVSRSGIPAFIADYALAPERPFPAAIEDALRAYNGLVEQGARQIALAGDSAGGGLALALFSQVKNADPTPRSVVAISPWTDLALTSPSMLSRDAVDPIWSPVALAEMARLYLGNADLRNPLTSPVYADRLGLPPLLIHVGDAEILLDDALRYAEGVDGVEVHVWDGMLHVFPSSAGILDAADAALESIGKFIASTMLSNRDLNEAAS